MRAQTLQNAKELFLKPIRTRYVPQLAKNRTNPLIQAALRASTRPENRYLTGKKYVRTPVPMRE